MFYIEKVMKERGLSKTRLGFMAQIHPATIGKLLAGHIPPYPNYKRRLSEALGVPKNKLFEKVDEIRAAR
ncbi:MAG: helix-turn-helix transcriptional regulator [Thermoanaerobacter sp.]|nr:helix-turn-helix transcriptional regulator [Thermoanaerobacter sp.]